MVAKERFGRYGRLSRKRASAHLDGEGMQRRPNAAGVSPRAVNLRVHRVLRGRSVTKLRLKPPSRTEPRRAERICVTRRPFEPQLRQLPKPKTCLNRTDIGFRRCLVIPEMLTSRELERSRPVMTPRLLSGLVAIGLFVLSPGLLPAGAQGRAAPAAQTQPP